MAAREAIHQAALLRFRPILMTTLAALFGAVPLMLGGGEGSELRRPLGLAIFGGLIVSQLLTLFTTPVIYIAFDRLATRRGNPVGDAGARARPHEPVVALHPPADRDDPADDRHRAVGDRGVLRPAGVAAARSRFPDDRGQRAACRARRRRRWRRRSRRRSNGGWARSPTSAR